MATTAEVAAGLVGLCKEGKFDVAIDTYYDDGIVSIEAGGPEGMDPKTVGLASVKHKSEWWNQSFDVQKVELEGPFVNGDQFTAVFKLDVVSKADGKATHMEEIALYTVRDGKIVQEVFFM